MKNWKKWNKEIESSNNIQYNNDNRRNICRRKYNQ